MKKFIEKETKKQRSTSVLLKGHKYTKNLELSEKEKDTNNNNRATIRWKIYNSKNDIRKI